MNNKKLILKRELIFWGIVVAVILLVGIVYKFLNNRFLYEYLQKQKISAMKAAYEEINDYFNSESYDKETMQVTIDNLCEKNNANIVIIDSKSDMILSSSRDSERMGKVLMNYLFQFADAKIEETIEKTDDYDIYLVSDAKTNERYYDMWGVCDNGDLFLIRIALSSIIGEINRLSRFLNYFMVIIAVAAVIGLLVVSRVMFVRSLKRENEKLSQDIERKEKIDEMRKEFLSNVSHELKTPIALIQGYAEGLQDSVNTDEESKNFYCEVIIDEASKMNKMVSKLLDLNHLEFGDVELNYSRFDIIGMIRSFIESASILCEQKNATVRFSDITPIYVYSDEYYVNEIFANYFSNALNHLDGDNVIEITVEENADKVFVYVFNTGAPIPDESIERIWEKFYKVDKARTREYGGSGVGLSIVKATLDSMNQEYGVENFAEGVRFYFTVERAKNEENETDK